MTDPDFSAEPVPADRATISSSTPPAKRDALPLLYLLGFLVLAGALTFLYLHPATPPEAIAQQTDRLDAMEQQVRTLGTRLTQLEGRPTPAAPNLRPLEDRVASLENRPAPAPPSAAPAAPPVDLGPLSARVDELASKPPVDLAPLTARVDALASKQGADATALAGRLTTNEQRLAAAERQAGELSGLADRAQRLTRLQAASVALTEGQPLGDLPGAPSALAQFAHEPPPTLASLRLSFPAAAAAAHDASQPAITAKQPFLSRLWTRAQQQVTVRQGDRVLLGDPIGGVLTGAEQALDAGDVPGALKALEGLAGPAAAAMADWTGRAHALLDARAALATMARG